MFLYLNENINQYESENTHVNNILTHFIERVIRIKEHCSLLKVFMFNMLLNENLIIKIQLIQTK